MVKPVWFDRGTKYLQVLAFASLVMWGNQNPNAFAAEIATDPGDYTALPAGTNLAILYYQHASRRSVYSGGEKAPIDFKLDTDIGLLRFVHYVDVGGFIVDPQIILPFGRVALETQLGSLTPRTATGIGDPMLAATVWLYNDQEERQWFGITPAVSIPLGNYKDDYGPVNVGENRWKGILQAAYSRPLFGELMLDVVGEYSVYGDNDDYLGTTKSQKPGYGIQTHLRYDFAPTSRVALSYYQDWGGETTVGGVDQNDRKSNGRMLATFATFVTPSVQLQLQGGTDLFVENGPRESARFNLRFLKVF